jgi:hypothetical protein
LNDPKALQQFGRAMGVGPTSSEAEEGAAAGEEEEKGEYEY